ncbi:hypothetical protein HPB50_019473 [Hyalomma asiaticum]|uniref:Uncharacterized protein n=1 Tax=Hyalomma asiaticum TaxID=266040 RepID=A0ACB7S544_HYAAI|nr:hypothetical protein HPB50_019473 [Hyalomma asiaticum]
MNRFSVDLETNDSRAFIAIKQLCQTLLSVVARLAVIGTQAPIVCALACGAEVVLIFIIRYVIRATILSRQYESTRLSRLIQHLTETLDSAGMIRCYHVMEKFCAIFRRLMNDYLEAFNAFILSYSFTRLIVAVFGVLVILFAMVIVVLPNQGEAESSPSVGLSLLSALTVPFSMTGVFFVIFWGVLSFVALERALEYTEIPTEEDTPRAIESTSADANVLNPRLFLEPYDGLWPSRGVVRFQHFSASYRPGIVEDALKDICFEAHAGEKVAVVGRTGAGKSSLVLALLRMIERTSGSITIDGTDIYNVSLRRLRSAIAIIPQMDQDTDRRVQTALRESFSHCTLITIAHRIDTILDYDRVVVMGDGRVMEYGPVHELLADRRSTFRSMVIGAGIPLE